jgi:phospholipid/cholesterol/gamma-HCH transport system ATP-binding protein
MASARPILELTQLRPAMPAGELPSPEINLSLMAGDVALVEVRDWPRAAFFADLCAGLVPLAGGAARFLGYDWASIPDHYAAALRGRIGRIFAEGGWIEFLDVATNVLLPQLHHTREKQSELRERAAELARAFGLPGLPLVHVSDLSPLDLARSACVRAFLGKPAMALLESPMQGRAFFAELRTPLLNAIVEARSEGTAVIWLTSSEIVWNDRSLPTSHRFRLHDRGLVPARRNA